MSEERERNTERKGRGTGKKDRVSQAPFLIQKVIVFVIVLLSFVNPVYVLFFLEMAAIIKKRV